MKAGSCLPEGIPAQSLPGLPRAQSMQCISFLYVRVVCPYLPSHLTILLCIYLPIYLSAHITPPSPPLEPRQCQPLPLNGPGCLTDEDGLEDSVPDFRRIQSKASALLIRRRLLGLSPRPPRGSESAARPAWPACSSDFGFQCMSRIRYPTSRLTTRTPNTD